MILILRLIFIVFYIGTLGLFIKGLYAKSLPTYTNLLGLFFLISVLVFLIYRLSLRLFRETNYITLNNDTIIIYNVAAFQKKKFKTSDCIFFSSNRGLFESYIIKLPTGKYINLLSYDYLDFKKLKTIFSDFGIEYSGFIIDKTV